MLKNNKVIKTESTEGTIYFSSLRQFSKYYKLNTDSGTIAINGGNQKFRRTQNLKITVYNSGELT